jgi:hypothetical protein
MEQAVGVRLGIEYVFLPEPEGFTDFVVPEVGLTKINFLVRKRKQTAHNLALGGKKTVPQQLMVVVAHGYNITVLGIW